MFHYLVSVVMRVCVYVPCFIDCAFVSCSKIVCVCVCRAPVTDCVRVARALLVVCSCSSFCSCDVPAGCAHC